jgi:hypothetical protein
MGYKIFMTLVIILKLLRISKVIVIKIQINHKI